MTVRALEMADWPDAESLYWELTRSSAVAGPEHFRVILSHPGTRVFGKEVEGRIVAMATLHVLPNMTYGGQPYGLVENVVTSAPERGRGHGRDVMGHLSEAARTAGCYKLMLLTGRGRQARGFYEAVGFSCEGKWGMMIRF